jgi:hypothetical protein
MTEFSWTILEPSEKGRTVTILDLEGIGVFDFVGDVVNFVRKSIGMALSVLSPGRYYSTYAECMRQVKQRPNRNVFNYVADEITKQLKSEIMISVVGRIKLDKKKLDDMLGVLVNKVDVRNVDGTKEKPTGHTECKAECCEIKCSGWGSASAWVRRLRPSKAA